MLDRRSFLTAAAAALPAHAFAQGVSPLASAVDQARGFGRMHALIVLKDGETLVEEQFTSASLDRPANIKSVSKTIVAAILGAAVDRGAVPSVTARLGDVAPSLIPQGADPRVADITLEDLVTLRAGLERTSGPNYGTWVSSSNWVANALSRPLIAEPGGRMLYSTGSTHILGAALARATGRSLLDLARDWLGAPLAIDIPAWTRDPQGFYLGGNDMALSPRALVSFGEMIRQNGLAGEARVLSEDWLAASFVPRTRSPWSGLGYGYGWFLGRAAGQPYALARGYGGQVVVVAPSLGVTMVSLSDPTRPARSGGYFGDLQRLIERDILETLASS
ncbi:MAG: serine hydrolase [Pseudomonadota bacterium]